MDDLASFRLAAAALTADASASGVHLNIRRGGQDPSSEFSRLYEAYIDDRVAAGQEVTFVDPYQFAIELVEFIQEVMLETIHGAWPECKIHLDPMVAVIERESGKLVWTCAHSDQEPIEVGRLGEAGE